jgi:aryl-alcohol dehydrogenase-like predicted oxidoreductase
MNLWNQAPLGRTGLTTSRLGLASSFGVGTPDVERAFERGINYLYWGSLRRAGFGKAIANLAPRHRDRMVVAVQSYTRVGWLMRGSLERALRKLRLEYADVLVLGWWQSPPPPRILDAALALKESGKARHLLISCHHRPTFEALAKNPAYGAIMVRYNAAHPGAEREVFPLLGDPAPGVVAYTATRWGALLNPRLVPPGEQVPRASDCYRFALTHPAVNVVLSGPKNAVELDESMVALDRGPLSDEEVAWMKRVGAAVRASAILRSGNPVIRLIDRFSAPKKLPAGPTQHQGS